MFVFIAVWIALNCGASHVAVIVVAGGTAAVTEVVPAVIVHHK